MSNQKYHHGDLVRIAKDLGPHMGHFVADEDAIVIGSYKDQYGGSDDGQYTIHIKGGGRTSWYYESQLTLIESGRADLLQEWEAEKERQRVERSDLDWIFNNGEEVLAQRYGSSIEALARCVGMNNLWGSNGEGFVYMHNAMRVLSFAAEYLANGDKAGYLARCEEVCK